MIPMCYLPGCRRRDVQIRDLGRQLQGARNFPKRCFFFIAYRRTAATKKATLFRRFGYMLTDQTQPAFEGRSIVWCFCINLNSSLS